MIFLEALASELENKTILITGGSGFFGKSLCEALNNLNQRKNLGMKIYALARNPISLEGIEFIQQDVTKPFSFDLKIDFIIHAATPVVSDESHFDNNIDIIVNGTKNALSFAEKVQASKFLLVSSGAVYGEQPDDVSAIPEDYVIKENFFDFKSAYGTGKRISELLALDWARRTDSQLTIARCFAFAGKYLPIDKHLAIGNFIRDALHEKVITIKGDGLALRTYMDSDDLVEWLMTILLHGEKEQIYNVGSDVEISIKDLAYKVSSMVPGTKVDIQNKNVSAKRNRYIPSIKKAQTSLNLKITTNLDKSIQKMIDFNRGQKND